jgi:hypothetical protein
MQKELYGLIRDLELLKNKAELLSSGRHYESDSILPRQKVSVQFLITQGELAARKNIEGLMAAMNIRYNLEEWRLFTNCPMHSLKAVLLHKSTVLPSITVAYAVHKQEI